MNETKLLIAEFMAVKSRPFSNYKAEERVVLTLVHSFRFWAVSFPR